MKLSVSIMACREREKHFNYLKENLGDVPFSIDELLEKEGHIGIWENCKRAWRMHDKNADYHLVLQDDSIICKDFYFHANLILESLKEDYVISFYAGNRLRNHIDQALREGKNHVIYSNIINENALCMPVRHIEPMIEFCDSRKAKNDKLIAKYARLSGLQTYYTIPSLIDHRDEPSIYRKNYNRLLPDLKRKAYKFI